MSFVAMVMQQSVTRVPQGFGDMHSTGHCCSGVKFIYLLVISQIAVVAENAGWRPESWCHTSMIHLPVPLTLRHSTPSSVNQSAKLLSTQPTPMHIFFLSVPHLHWYLILGCK